MFWRSIGFTVAFALQTVAIAAASLPIVLFLPRRHVLAVAKFWCRRSVALTRGILGIEVEIRGHEHIPTGAAIVAAKHQSELETFAMVPAIRDPLFVLKRELTWIPFFGWFLMRLRMIAINRSAGSDALAQILAQAKIVAAEDRQIIIFPEGTRRPIGAPPRYKHGVSHLYRELDLPVTPVAMDTGAFWPRSTWRRRPGRTVIEFLEPIPPGLDRATFERMLQERIEGRSAALAAESLGVEPSSPVDSGGNPLGAQIID
ncbi:1-acyl-sn-glycerol-3-phosphate acyltransferase [Methylopila capsulata]|uniref:1-acyl-sn-glycerol-3-phosphate acyltransferase n=1 Tax=Methylopila capsulata TaxID=61654 RepID=A0A9W6IQW0_9HYPH|nr:1-acyl-sn-glycerol-3-phosphate acyltransferase [Methylopila capsulata]MBM7851793.1 1-acyl-sn-glycerol-3-phosphate acyltransferase [Methylopila capsulata]GLK54857.1 1-acyl-sn-glycerol-3-phosphate acyltransferase [Methylopila capsulata]